jgi:hypothetical protein
LNGKDVGIENLQLADRELQPIFKRGASLEKSRARAVVQKIIGDDAQGLDAVVRIG